MNPVRLTTSTINKLVLARHLFRIADSNLQSHRDVALFAAINVMQDSLEAFLLAVSEAVGASTAAHVNFDKYFENIEQEIKQPLPFRLRLNGLNKTRVNAKHYGIRPDRMEVIAFSQLCREFFDSLSESLLGCNFWSVSLLELLPDGEVKEILETAQANFERRDFLACLIECRKVIFVEFESEYDVWEFKDGGESKGLLGPHSRAPNYAKTKDYIEKWVTCPFDFIVLDHSELDRELLKNGIDPGAFWNIWRLTPEVYRFKNKEWTWQLRFEKTEDVTEENASYVLEHTIDIALRRDEMRRQIRTKRSDLRTVILKPHEVKVYRKADRNSSVVTTIPATLREVAVVLGTVGLDGEGRYWNISHINRVGVGGFIWGYIDDADVLKPPGLPSEEYVASLRS